MLKLALNQAFTIMPVRDAVIIVLYISVGRTYREHL